MLTGMIYFTYPGMAVICRRNKLTKGKQHGKQSCNSFRRSSQSGKPLVVTSATAMISNEGIKFDNTKK